jgi:hypothetical protein
MLKVVLFHEVYVGEEFVRDGMRYVKIMLEREEIGDETFFSNAHMKGDASMTTFFNETAEVVVDRS